MIDPPIIGDQILSENFKLMIYPGHGKMIDPLIIGDQTFSENFKFKSQPGYCKMIDPPYSW